MKDTKSTAKYQDAGQCPQCGSLELEYGGGEFDGGQYVYEVHCNDCGCDAKEWHDLVYIQTVINGEDETL